MVALFCNFEKVKFFSPSLCFNMYIKTCAKYQYNRTVASRSANVLKLERSLYNRGDRKVDEEKYFQIVFGMWHKNTSYAYGFTYF